MSELYLCELNKLKSIKSVCSENASQLSNCTTSALGPKFDSLPNCHQKGRPLAPQLRLPEPDSRAWRTKEAQGPLGLGTKTSSAQGQASMWCPNKGHHKVLWECLRNEKCTSSQLLQSDSLKTVTSILMMFSTDPPATLHEETNIGKNRVTLVECLAVPWTAEGSPYPSVIRNTCTFSMDPYSVGKKKKTQVFLDLQYNGTY